MNVCDYSIVVAIPEKGIDRNNEYGKKMISSKISIVVPIYKVELYLERCVKSLVNQTYENIEIILVDDGSPDNCPNLCDNWSTLDERIKVIHKENGGLSDARNVGIDEANGEYLLLVDADDYLELDACERFLDVIKKNKSDFVVGVIKEIRTSSITLQKRTTIEPNISMQPMDFIIKSIDANEWYASSCLNFYCLDFLNKNNLRFVKGIIHEDMEFLPRLFLTAKSVSYMDYPFYNYVIRDNSIMTSGISLKKIDDILLILKNWKIQFDHLDDKCLREKLYGVLIKHYLYSAKRLKIKKWKVEGLDFGFSSKYALNTKERIKVYLYNYFPYIYLNLLNIRRIE